MLRRFLRRPHNTAQPVPREAPASTHPAIVDDDGFVAALRDSSLLTIVDFWAEWCQPCDVMAIWLERLAAEYAGSLRILALDVDENPKTPERYGVMGLPTLIAFRDGEELFRTTGVSTYDGLKREIDKLLVIRESEAGSRE